MAAIRAATKSTQWRKVLMPQLIGPGIALGAGSGTGAVSLAKTVVRAVVKGNHLGVNLSAGGTPHRRRKFKGRHRLSVSAAKNVRHNAVSSSAHNDFGNTVVWKGGPTEVIRLQPDQWVLDIATERLCTVADIQSLNPTTNLDRVFAGQSLVVPCLPSSARGRSSQKPPPASPSTPRTPGGSPAPGQARQGDTAAAAAPSSPSHARQSSPSSPRPRSPRAHLPQKERFRDEPRPVHWGGGRGPAGGSSPGPSGTQNEEERAAPSGGRRAASSPGRDSRQTQRTPRSQPGGAHGAGSAAGAAEEADNTAAGAAAAAAGPAAAGGGPLGPREGAASRAGAAAPATPRAASPPPLQRLVSAFQGWGRGAGWRGGGGGAAAAVEYEMQPGEWVWDVLQREGVDLAALRRANPGVDLNRVKAGQRIRLPQRGMQQEGPGPGSTRAEGGRSAGGQAPEEESQGKAGMQSAAEGGGLAGGREGSSQADSEAGRWSGAAHGGKERGSSAAQPDRSPAVEMAVAPVAAAAPSAPTGLAAAADAGSLAVAEANKQEPEAASAAEAAAAEAEAEAAGAAVASASDASEQAAPRGRGPGWLRFLTRPPPADQQQQQGAASPAASSPTALSNPPAAPLSAPLSAPPTTAPQGPVAVLKTRKLRRAESVESVAREFGLSLPELQQMNPGVDLRAARAGQMVLVPARHPTGQLLPGLVEEWGRVEGQGGGAPAAAVAVAGGGECAVNTPEGEGGGLQGGRVPGRDGSGEGGGERRGIAARMLLRGALHPAGMAGADVAQHRAYMVMPGDSLGEIAERFGVSWEAVARLNGLPCAAGGEGAVGGKGVPKGAAAGGKGREGNEGPGGTDIAAGATAAAARGSFPGLEVGQVLLIPREDATPDAGRGGWAQGLLRLWQPRGAAGQQRQSGHKQQPAPSPLAPMEMELAAPVPVRLRIAGPPDSAADAGDAAPELPRAAHAAVGQAEALPAAADGAGAAASSLFLLLLALALPLASFLVVFVRVSGIRGQAQQQQEEGQGQGEPLLPVGEQVPLDAGFLGQAAQAEEEEEVPAWQEGQEGEGGSGIWQGRAQPEVNLLPWGAPAGLPVPSESDMAAVTALFPPPLSPLASTLTSFCLSYGACSASLPAAPPPLAPFVLLDAACRDAAAGMALGQWGSATVVVAVSLVRRGGGSPPEGLTLLGLPSSSSSSPPSSFPSSSGRQQAGAGSQPAPGRPGSQQRGPRFSGELHAGPAAAALAGDAIAAVPAFLSGVALLGASVWDCGGASDDPPLQPHRAPKAHPSSSLSSSSHAPSSLSAAVLLLSLPESVLVSSVSVPLAAADAAASQALDGAAPASPAAAAAAGGRNGASRPSSQQQQPPAGHRAQRGAQSAGFAGVLLSDSEAVGQSLASFEGVEEDGPGGAARGVPLKAGAGRPAKRDASFAGNGASASAAAAAAAAVAGRAAALAVAGEERQRLQGPGEGWEAGRGSAGRRVVAALRAALAHLDEQLKAEGTVRRVAALVAVVPAGWAEFAAAQLSALAPTSSIYALSCSPYATLLPSWHVSSASGSAQPPDGASSPPAAPPAASAPSTAAAGATGVGLPAYRGPQPPSELGPQGVSVLAVQEGSEVSGAVLAAVLGEWLFGALAVVAAAGPRQ